MNAVWNSYGQLCGCPEIFKKSCKFFCRELDIRVAQVVEAELAAPGVVQDCLYPLAHRGRVQGRIGLHRGREHPLRRGMGAQIVEDVMAMFGGGPS